MPATTRKNTGGGGVPPADRVYRSEAPMKQTKLAGKKRRKLPTYGKIGGPRVPKLAVQETLTQMDYIFHQRPEDDFGDEQEDEGYQPSRAKASKRRKTLGDESASESKFHTQRLTQMDWSFSSNMDDEEEEGLDGTMKESEKLRSPDKKVDVQSMLPPPRTPKRTRPMEIPPSESPASPISPVHYGSPEKSPLKRILRNSTLVATEVEKVGETSAKKRKTSQSQSTASPRRPLQEKLDNAIPFSLSPAAVASPRKKSKLVIQDTFETDLETQQSHIPSSPPKIRSPMKSVKPKLVIEDTFETDLETQRSRIPSSPQKRSSPAKSVRFKTPDHSVSSSPLSGVSRILQSPILESEPRPPRPSILKLEISDSEEESDLEEVSEDEEPALPLNLEHEIYNAAEEESQVIEETPDDEIPIKIEDKSAEGDSTEALQYDTYYEDFGADRQMYLDELERDISASSGNMEEEEEEEQEEEEFEARDTQYGKTQGMESQRLSTQHVHMMAPRTMSSDIFLSAHPQTVTEIVSRSKNHYFSSHMLPSNVSRIWLYETDPVRVLKYMASISQALKPGELKDEEGNGNADFNAGRMTVSKYAYEILEVYELADPLPLSELQRKEWLHKAPGAKAFVRPAVIGELIANLKPPLFTTAGHSPFTDTQEVEAQLVSESTQFQPSTAPASSPPRAEEHRISHKTSYVPLQSSSPHLPATKARSSQSSNTYTSVNRNSLRTLRNSSQHGRTQVRPSQASTVDLTQPPTQQSPTRRPSSRSSDIEIVFESPIKRTKHIPSSTPISSRGFAEDDHEHDTVSDTLIPLAMPSSQILTKSQLLPESLLTESVPPPPMFIGDSDEEDYEI